MRFRLLMFALSLWSAPIYADFIGIIGGYSGVAGSTPNTPYAALIDSSGSALLLSNLPSLPPYAYINTVSMNASGYSIMGGDEGNQRYSSPSFSYIALVDPSGQVQKLAQNANFTVFSSAMNSSGNAIVVGGNGGRIGFRVDFQGNQSALVLPGGGGTLLTAALNDSGLAAVGGSTSGYAALIPANSLTAGSSLTSSSVNSVSINSSGNSLVAGVNYAQFFNSTGGSITPVSLPGSTTINSASINDSNLALLGGSGAGSTPYASLVDFSGTPTSLSGLPSTGNILSVDLNALGYGILGGQDTSATAAYASFVDPNGVIYPISGLPVGSGASINSVAINDWGVALLGGTSDGSMAYAALASPWGGLMPLPVNAPQVIYSVSIRNFIPANNLNGNNLAFAEYIKDYARDKISYFVPSLFADTFNEALESAAPTRNAISLFTADNNLFYLSHSLSNHLRNHWHFRDRKTPPPVSQPETLLTQSEEIAGNYVRRNALRNCQPVCCEEENPPYSFWLELIQARAHQNSQMQTPGFNTSVGGGILGFDGRVGERVETGLGVAYTFTHVHEKEDSGSSDIYQEYAFVYLTWSDLQMYFDLALWGAAMQVDQARNISLTGWNFRSISSFHGWQVSPHLEIGADYIPNKECLNPVKKSTHWSANPFVMLDWISAWQERYQEKGDGPFNAAQKARYSSFLRTEIGLRFYEPISFSAWRLIFEEKASFVNKTPFGVGKISAYLVGSPGSFTVETLTKSQNLGAVECSVIFEPINHKYPYGSLSYQGEFASSTQIHQIVAELSLDF